MSDRWGLHRAGIINVFQYGEETLHFGGGRLLLRGVNGSGKSTAMNMLLPFLLDADVRRIDAAGEQSGMLRSWMLSGRTETQPTGYLWLEMKRAEAHLVFGCGIKANRNTDTVNHWWFVTERRPGVDLELVQRHGGSRSPLSAEQLRAELGTDCVWSKDQRPAYRQALHGRLYGGANLDQHLRLLHIVRNPRVGDRVDVDLPIHLHDALPRLSDAAVDDAATPLEKLEEHRHNVAQLASTVRALDALVDTYRQHAQSELRTRAVAADDVARSHRRHEGDLRSAREAHEGAGAAVKENGAAADRWAVAVDLHQGEIDTLKKGSAYQDHIQLEDKKEALRQLGSTVDGLKAEEDHALSALSEAQSALTNAAQTTAGSERKVKGSADALVQAARAARLEAAPPVVPAVPAAPIRSERGTDDPLVPTGHLDLAEAQAALHALRGAAQHRTGDVAEARDALDLVNRAAEELQTAERRLASSRERHEAAALGETAARSTLQAQANAWRDGVAIWDQRLAEHLQQAPLLASIGLAAPVAPGTVIAAHDALADERRATINVVQQEHAGRAAELTVQRQQEQETFAAAEAIVAELAGRTLPDPPNLPWQSVRTGPSLAELVDFAEDLGESERAGLEAALEAGGLLAAEVRANGLVSAAGDLLAVPGPPLRRSLADVLRVAVPDDLAVLGVDDAFVRSVLAAVSVEPADLGAPSGPTTVTLAGEFRLGPLRGRHTKDRVEHVGVSARRAALDRQRIAAAQALDAAVLALDVTEAALTVLTQQRRSADQLAADLPSTSPLVQAIAGLAHAETTLASAQAEVDDQADRRDQAEATHATRGDAFRRRCGELDLPHDATALAAIDRACEQVPPRADNTSAALDHLAASVEGWLAAGERWMEATRRRDRAEDQHRRKHDALAAARHELATLEDQIGLDARQVMDTLETAQRSLHEAKVQLELVTKTIGPAQQLLGQAVAVEKQAEAALSASDQRCVQTLEHLRKAVSIPGLLGAALVRHLDDEDVGETGPDPAEPADGDPTLALLPTVPATGAGLRTYARALIDLVPEVPHTPGDNVRAALIKRRPDLGAGWDAQDRQPDASLPLSVEVVGPLGTLPLIRAAITATDELRTAQGLLTAQQDGALRNLLQGLIADEVAEKMHAADELVTRMNTRLTSVRTTHGVGVSLRWKQRGDLSEETQSMVDLLGKRSDFRQDPEADALLVAALSTRIDEARRAEPESSYATLIARLFDYRDWHQLAVMVHRPGEEPKRLKKGTALSEGEKKMVSYQPLFAAVAASCDALAEVAPTAPRFVLLDDAFAKVSEDNHPKLFGLLVDLELDFIATSERLWGTHDTVPELVITEVLRDADAGVIMLEHSHWDGRHKTEPA